MTEIKNDFGQSIGVTLPHWYPPLVPPHEPMEGWFCRLEPLDLTRHALSLYEANAIDADGRNWTYLPYGPFETYDAYIAWVDEAARSTDTLFYAIIDREKHRAVGVAAYLRILPASGSIEVGHVNYSPLLQHTPMATEAMYLMMSNAFDLGYRRYEWKCDALNAPSRAAAQRLGFSFEGVFRQATVYKGRNRDTAWFSVLDQEWPRLKEAFVQWLDASNYDEHGRQKLRLTDLTRPLLAVCNREETV